LIIAARLRPRGIDDTTLGGLAEWVLAEETFERRDRQWNRTEAPPAAFSIQHGFWQPLAVELKDHAAAMPAGEARTNLELCAMIVGMA
jgi:hypothetical protein